MKLHASLIAAQDELRKTYLDATLLVGEAVGVCGNTWICEYTGDDGPPWSVGRKDVTEFVNRFVFNWHRRQAEEPRC
jgi:hypothetical protein